MSCGAGPWPVALALAAAFLFGLGIQLTRPGLRHTDSRTAALIQIGTACAVYWLASPAFLQRWYWLEPAIALLAAIGLFRPFISANLAQMLAKIGMESIPSPFFVGLVGYSVSFALALATQRGRQDAGPVRSPGLPWLMLAGLCYALAILALNSALVCGDLVAVSPIVACQPFFSLLLGRLLFREAQIDARVMVAVALVVPGVVLVILR